MHKKTNQNTEQASFDIQKNPLVVKLEKKLSTLQKKKKQFNTRLRQNKTKLKRFKEDILDVQNQLSVKVSSRLNDIENLRKEIISLCRKLAKSKKISKLERKEVRELEKEFSTQRFFPEDMEEFARQRNAGKENEQGSNFFKKFSVEPQELERRDIRKIYLRLADQFHPDRSRTAEQNEHFHELMKSINEAYKNYDVETLLSIEAEYSNGSNMFNAGNAQNEPDYVQKLEENIRRVSKEIEFLKSQAKRATQEMKKLKKSEPGQMMLEKQQAEKEGKDGLELLTADMERGYKHLLSVKEVLEKCAKEGKMSGDIMASIFGGDFGEFMIDSLIENFKQEFGAELEGMPEEVIRKIVKEMVQAQMVGEEEPDMDEFYDVFMESMMENNFTEVFTPSKKATKKRNKTKKKMDHYERYEESCKKIRKANKRLLDEFGAWLKSSGLAEKTVNNHISNADFYINEYLLYEDATTEAKDGIHAVDMFLGDWFIRKAMWASKSSIKGNAASLKKFYTFLLDKGLIDKEDLVDLKQVIKEEMPEWLESLTCHDNSPIGGFW